MAGDRIQFVAVATTIVQLGIGTLALWALWDTKVSSDPFSLEYAGVPLSYKPAAILVPGALMFLFAIALVSALLWSQFRPACWLCTISLGLALTIVAGWWVVLGLSNYRNFFIATGKLAPNEIMGASWSLFIVVALLSLAAVLGMIPLLFLAVQTRAAKS